jgi:hypothetical protein
VFIIRLQSGDDARNIDPAQPARLDLSVSINSAEQRSGGDARQFYPRLHCADRTRLRVRSIRNADLPAGAILIDLGPP